MRGKGISPSTCVRRLQGVDRQIHRGHKPRCGLWRCRLCPGEAVGGRSSPSAGTVPISDHDRDGSPCLGPGQKALARTRRSGQSRPICGTDCGHQSGLATSLLQDLDAGRPLELDAWSGGAVKIGQELGIPTPSDFAIYAGLKPYEHGRA